MGATQLNMAPEQRDVVLDFYGGYIFHFPWIPVNVMIIITFISLTISGIGTIYTCIKIDEK
jgi:hypothetical protein